MFKRAEAGRAPAGQNEPVLLATCRQMALYSADPNDLLQNLKSVLLFPGLLWSLSGGRSAAGGTLLDCVSRCMY